MAMPFVDSSPRTHNVRNSVRGLPVVPTAARPTGNSDHARDFWIPQVTEDGQIYYANTLTGRFARDLPRDSEEDGADGVLAAFQSSSRTTSGDEPGFVPVRNVTAPPNAIVAVNVNDTGTSLSPRTSQVSDMPIKPLPLPGMITSRPRANTASQHNPNRAPSVPFDSPSVQSRQRRFSTSDPSVIAIQMNMNSSSVVWAPSHLEEPSEVRDVREIPPGGSRTPSQQSVPTDVVSELLQRTRQCIHSVILHLRQFGIPQVAEDEEIVDNLIAAAITAIRDLLYVSGPSGRHLGGKNKVDRDTSNASQTPLVPAERRAVATLSKFVLSARAIINDGPWVTDNSVSQLSSDADELERSVVEFVSIAQDVRSQSVLDPRRLHGYMSPPPAGSANVGAGTAGTWKGFGWVNIEDHEEAPRQNLTSVTFNEFVRHTVKIQEKLGTLSEALRATQTAEVVATSAQELLRELSTLVLLLGDIHIARHVDIETVDETKVSKLFDGVRYMRSIEKARILVRALEATTQAIYDDGAALLVATQSVRRVEPSESWKSRDQAYDALDTLSSSIDFNLNILRQNLEGLLHIGTEQTAILERCNKTPIEWRMSQRSLLSAILNNQALEAIYDNHGSHDVSVEEPDRMLRSVAEDVEDSSSSLSSLSPPPVPTSGKPRIIPDEEEPAETAFEDDDTLEAVRSPPRSHKIKAFFGDDAPKHYLISLSAESKPWYLRPQYNPEEVLIDPDGTVRGGTVPALVERLTAHEYADTNFSRAFLMTFKSFMTLDELFTLLVERFWIQPPLGLNAQELDDWRYNKQNIIRIRVINTMKSIIQDEDLIEKEDAGILDRMAQFASGEDVCRVAPARNLLAAIKRAHNGNQRRVTLQSSVPPPQPIVPRRIELLDIDPLELARQLTITESQLYLKIRPSECLQRSKQSRTEYRDGVANFIKRSNRIAQWVTYSILCKDDPRRRATIMKQFILIADRCRVIQNFSTMMAIVTGLNSSPIRRLKRSWEQVNSRYMSQLEACETIINSYKHYNSYRSSLASLSPPCVPFVGVFLTALTHIQDGSKDLLPGDLVNFRKRQKTSEVIQDLQRWQNQPHNFHPLPSVLVFIDEGLNQFGDHDAGEVFWKLSMEREPREKDEERLAKFLTDSGFS